MCEELGIATSVRNQYDGVKYSHTCVEFRLLLGVCISRHKTDSRDNGIPVNKH